MLLNTSLWALYGISRSSYLIIVTVFGIGAVLHIFYVITFIIYAPNKTRLLKLVGAIIVILGIVLYATLVIIKVTKERYDLVGFISSAVEIAMWASQIPEMKRVIKYKNVKYMPSSFLDLLLHFVNVGDWFVFGVFVKDPYLMVSNGIGFLVSSSQLIVYLAYRNKIDSEQTTTALSEIIITGGGIVDREEDTIVYGGEEEMEQTVTTSTEDGIVVSGGEEIVLEETGDGIVVGGGEEIVVEENQPVRL